MNKEEIKYFGTDRYDLNNVFESNGKEHPSITNYSKSDPYLFNICDYRNNFKGIHDSCEHIDDISTITDKSIIEKHECKYNVIADDKVKTITNWIDFFYYINGKIKDAKLNGEYEYSINIPIPWVDNQNIIKMILRHLIFKGFNCSLIFDDELDHYAYTDEENIEDITENYLLIISWDNLPKGILDTHFQTETDNEPYIPGIFKWKETKIQYKK